MPTLIEKRKDPFHGEIPEYNGLYKAKTLMESTHLPYRGSVITDGISHYVVLDFNGLCMSLESPGRVFKIPMRDQYEVVAEWEDYMSKFIPDTIKEVKDRLVYSLPHVLERRNIDPRSQSVILKHVQKILES
jgi:hypothetical protein